MNAIFVETLDLGGSGPVVAVKDTIDIAGFPTRAASRALAGAPPAERHADVVAALLAAGCRIVGKTNLHELAYGVTGINSWTGTPINPLYPDRIPGGSSSGSAAAVAAGLVDFALGTDTGGSIRIPAACCGVVGLKPSFGRVSRAGVMPAESSLDCVGPIARTVSLIESAMAMMAPGFSSKEDPIDWRLGVVDIAAAPEVEARFAQALLALGGEQASMTLPVMDEAFDAALVVIGAETLCALGRHATSPSIGADVRARVSAAERLTLGDLRGAEAVRAQFCAAVDAALDAVDAIVLPTMPAAPVKLAEAGDSVALVQSTRFVRPFNLSGHPAITLPLPASCGFSVGLQLVGRRGGDAALCALARAAESRLASHFPFQGVLL